MKISVVMPTLNSAKYIEVSLKSLMAQTFKEFEVIAVDSGSMDETLNVLDEYSEKGLNVRVISACGLSPALARNIGIKNSSGDFLAFCDSDDIMKADMLKSMYETAVSNNADVVVCDFNMVYPNRTIERFACLSNGKFNIGKANIVDYYYEFCAAPKPNNYVWSRLYRRSFFEDNALMFPDVRYSEDHLLNLSLLLKIPKIVHIGEALYNYMQYDDSAMRMHIKKTNHGLLFLDGFRKAADTLATADQDIYESILAIYAYTRVKSIMFYAWQANLEENGIIDAVSVFVSDAQVKKHLSLCIEQNYIGRYCLLHGLSNDWENKMRAMLCACIEDSKLPDMCEVFA